MPTAGSIGPPSSSSPHRARRSRARGPRRRRPPRCRPLGRERTNHGRGREDTLGIVDHARVAALGPDHRAERLERLPRVERRGRPRPPLPHRDVREPGHRLAGEHHRRVAQASVQLAAEQPDGLDHVERVPIASPSGWDMSVTAARVGRPQSCASAVHASASSAASSGVFMNAPLPAFTSRDKVRADRELLRHHARRDQRHRRTVAVASRSA